MCGIIGYIGARPCGDILLDGLRRLEYRGYDSAGVAIHTGRGIERIRAEGKLGNLEAAYRRSPIEGTLGVGHTRWATHGRPSERNAHPHRVGRIVLVHNGIIENHVELRNELRRDGATFESETDTEIAAHLVARARASAPSLHAAVLAMLARVRGSYALVVLDEDDPDVFVVARSASPLVVGLGQGETFAASDVPAIMAHTRDVVFLEDGDTAVLRRDGAAFFDATGAPAARASKRITWDPIAAEKQGYKHFMLKEIHEQPARVVDTLRGRIRLDSAEIDFPDLALDPARVRALDRIVILACGTSYHAGLIGKVAIEVLARIPVEVDLASEFRYRDPIVTDRTLAIAVSQSGETADTLAATGEAARRGATTLAICNVMESSLTRQCGATIYTQAGPEIGVASTKAFTTQLAAFYLLAIWLGQVRGVLDRTRRSALLDELRRVPGLMEQALELEPAIREIAREYAEAQSFLYLGRGPQFPIALEGALKLKEISYIHAEGYAGGEMKHGPIALIDEHLPVVLVAPRDRHFEKIASNLEEVKARGGRVITVTSETDAGVAGNSSHVLVVPGALDLYLPLVTIVPLQLLAYAVADFKGTDVDQPRNLAKSVTVE